MQVQMMLTGDMEYTPKQVNSKKDGKTYTWADLQYMGGSVRVPETAMGTHKTNAKCSKAVLLGTLRPSEYGVAVEIDTVVDLK